MNTDKNRFGFDTLNLTVYSGYYTDDLAVSSSASGGAGTALSECIVNSGGSVFGVVYTHDFKSACFACAESIKELDQFKTSKYIATEKRIQVNGEWVSVFEEVGRKLSGGKTVLFIGLGCDVGALLKYLKNHDVNIDNLYTVDLICHGPTCREVQKQYIEALEKRYKSKVVEFSVRYKAQGWTPPFIRAKFENGKIFMERFYESDFGFAFKAFSQASCYQCQFKGENHQADLTIGDYWGCTKEMDSYNPLGVSVIFCRSEKGKQLVQMISDQDRFDLRVADMNIALSHNRMFYSRREKNVKQYEQFKTDFEEKGLHYAVKHNSDYKAFRLQILKRKIRKFIPRSAIQMIRKAKKRLISA